MTTYGSLNKVLKKEILVQVKPEYREKNLEIAGWLVNSVNTQYVILYHCFFPTDGQWNHTDKKETWAVVFEDEDVSFLFKMTWG